MHHISRSSRFWLVALALVGACTVEAQEPTTTGTPTQPGVRTPGRGVSVINLPEDNGGTDAGPVTGPPSDACTGIELCGDNAFCQSCYIEGECASGPDPVWDGTECVCAQGGLDPRCDLDYCCAQGDVFDHTVCDCVPEGGGGSGSDTGSGGSDTGSGGAGSGSSCGG